MQMNFRASILVSAFAAVIVLVGAADAHACSCAGGVSMEQRFRSSDGAIIGRLVKVERLDQSTALHTYGVRRVYKGRRRIDEGEKLVLKTERFGASCGLPDREGKAYGLFLEKNAPRWSASLCTVVSASKMRRAGEDRGGRAMSRCGDARS
jgi:hypothetical protein